MVLKKALDGAAEALRRLFGAPQVRRLSAPVPQAVGRGGALLAGEGRSGHEPLAAASAAAALFEGGSTAVSALPPLEARLCMEEGWASWSSEAKVQVPELFPSGAAARWSVPPLPQGRAQRIPTTAPEAPGCRSLTPQVPTPRAFRIPAQAFQFEVHKDLRPALRRPFVFATEDIQGLPKALWMRYSLALVKATGENVRNLEVLGLWRVPRKGLSGIRPDADGKLWVQLSADASEAPRAAFMVARKKDDQSLVSAFVE